MVKVVTQLGITRLKASNVRREIPDGGLSGLYVIVQPAGSKSFALLYRINGKTKKLTLGRFPALSLTEARGRAREAMERLSYGEDPARQSGNPERFEKAFQTFLERHVSQIKGTYETTRIYEHGYSQLFAERSCQILVSGMSSILWTAS